MATVQRPQLETSGRRCLLERGAASSQFGGVARSDRDEAGVREFRVPGDEFRLALCHRGRRSVMTSANAKPTAGALLFVSGKTSGIAVDLAC